MSTRPFIVQTEITILGMEKSGIGSASFEVSTQNTVQQNFTAFQEAMIKAGYDAGVSLTSEDSKDFLLDMFDGKDSDDL